MIYWKLNPVVKEEPGNVLVELQWGWTAGMTEEDLKNYAEDAPTGYDSVTTTLDMAEQLRDELTEIIEKYKARNEELRLEEDQKFKERFPEFNALLTKFANQENPQRSNESSP